MPPKIDLWQPNILTYIYKILTTHHRVNSFLDAQTNVKIHSGLRTGKELIIQLSSKTSNPIYGQMPWAEGKVFSSLTNRQKISCSFNVGLKTNIELELSTTMEMLNNIFHTSKGKLEFEPEFYMEGPEIHVLKPIYNLVRCWYGQDLLRVSELMVQESLNEHSAIEELAFEVVEGLYPLMEFACNIKNMLATLDIGCESNHGRD